VGYIFKCTCKDCQHKFDLYDGDGRYSIGLICDSCGAHSGFPRSAPRPDRQGNLKWNERLRGPNPNPPQPPIPASEIRRFSDEELTQLRGRAVTAEDPDHWDDFEKEAFIRLKNPCRCGGLFDLARKTERPHGPGWGPNTLTRCPQCKSGNLGYEERGCWD